MTELEQFDLLIDGKRVPAADGARFQSEDPYAGLPWASVADGGPEDVDRAVAAARRALTGEWGAWSGAQRAAVMHRLADLIEADAGRLTAIETRDNGKLHRDAASQVALLPVWLRYFAGLADKLNGDAIFDAHRDYFVYTRHEPIGVVGAILPWNAPLILGMYKIAPALAAGCTIVAKPSEFTSVSMLVLGDYFAEAGFPSGVMNVVAGSSRETGAALAAHPDVSRIAFTGSTRTGVAVAQAGATHQAKVSLELGGKSPQIVFEDADLDDVVNGLVAGVFAAAGQMCHAGSRVYVEKSRYHALVDRLAERARAVVAGDPNDERSDIGPISTGPQFERVRSLLSVARDQGATFVTGDQPVPPGGFFIAPTVLTDVTTDMDILREEVFGPVVIVTPFEDEDDAIAQANDTEFGLAAGIWTNDLRRAHRVAAKVQSGMVWVNCYRVASPAVPFGGAKASGVGRENGIRALLEYTEEKAIWIEMSGKARDPFRMG